MNFLEYAHCLMAMSISLIPKILTSLPYKKSMAIAAYVLQSSVKTTLFVNQAEAKSKGPISGWAKVQADFEAMVRLLKNYVTGKYVPASSHFIIKILGGIVYFLFITDLIPDFLPGIGLADDIAVIAWIAKTIGKELETFRFWEASR